MKPVKVADDILDRVEQLPHYLAAVRFVHRPGWDDEAACRQPATTHGPDTWWELPDGMELRGINAVAVAANNRIAARVCLDACPVGVRVGCLGYALRRRMLDGVWGGYTPKQRAFAHAAFDRARKRQLAAAKDAADTAAAHAAALAAAAVGAAA